MADLDLQSLGMRLGEAITPTPRDAPQVRYGTIDAVNADGTLDVAIDGTTLRGMCATTGCVGAQAGMRCVVLRQGALATVVGLVANTYLVDVRAPDGGLAAKWLSVNGGAAAITSGGNATVNGLDVLGSVTYGGSAPMKDASDTVGQSLESGTWKALKSLTLTAGVWMIVAAVQYSGSSGVGYRRMNISQTSASTTISAAAGLSVPALNGGQTTISRSWIVDLSGSTTYYLNAAQSSGSAITAYCYFRAVRVA